MAKLLKANTHHQKARKYAPKGVDPATISPCLADVERLGPGILSAEVRALHERVAAMTERLMQDPAVQAES
ncbi:hypothetical protein [Synechococcus sp. CCY 9618]|uniref:hypothetical protein n=1 Tax=Synechococcus sp. CCY 9618 TaxID=2815602 RepID=UPI001C245E51|nr:hypothetical protein [Synechococcus sp. CCY 9618]